MLKPLADRVVLRIKEEEEKSLGGIVLASAAQEKPQVAEVVAVGPGKITPHGTVIAPTVQVGDAVLFEKFAGTNVKFEGEDFLIIKESDILAIV
ncbi:co-chaperone GroES [uncultured Lactococcus sp.]|uniref:co-chaperone GroES n=1 Tax=uncultured Lactococcus sp. TaxID=167973 RepID=UPI0027DDDBC5|nr:co-chaperone GroES [uncultured Lactococcus sp.]